MKIARHRSQVPRRRSRALSTPQKSCLENQPHEELPAGIAKGIGSHKAPGSTTIAITPPPNRSPPVARPVRPSSHRVRCAPEGFGRNDLSRPLRELQSYIGTQPLLRRQAPARDLRLEPKLYNWAVFGLAPGSLVTTSSLTGGEDGNSEDQHSASG